MSKDVIDHRMIGALHLEALRRKGFANLEQERHEVSQIGVLDSLMAGNFDGDTTLGELLAHGSQGLGTVQHLGGELIVLDGEAFVARADSSVTKVDHTMKTPFAVVSDFLATQERDFADIEFDDLCRKIDALTPDADAVVAIRIDGSFRNLVLRSVPEQSAPYKPLSEVIHEQRQWECERALGTMVGFRFPDMTAGFEVPGYHLHFISEDRKIGGHVVSLRIVNATAQTDSTKAVHVELPLGVDLGEPGLADRSQIRAIEGGAH